ncbi:C6 transcription factor [Botrytis cinerea]
MSNHETFDNGSDALSILIDAASSIRADRQTHPEFARSSPPTPQQQPFNRVDLLNRHVATHERNLGQNRPEIRRTERAGKACIACAAAKAKCEEQKPCLRCRTKDLVCEISQQSHKKRRISGIANEPRNSIAEQESLPRDSVTQLSSIPDLILHSIDENEDYTTTSSCPDNSAENAEATLQPSYPLSALNTDKESSDFNFIQDQLPFDSLANEMLFFPSTIFNNQISDFSFEDFDFQEENFEFPSLTSKRLAFDETTISGPSRKVNDSRRDVARGHAAFARSPWLWTPASTDHILRDRDNLAIDEENISLNLSPNGARPYQHLSITSSLRDKMFHLVSTTNRYANGIPSFPSLDLLNYIIEAFFCQQSNQVGNWIHTPTICLKDVRPELLIAIVAVGSTSISLPAIWRMGLALQDVVRLSVSELWERANSNTRKLQPLQAWMLSLELGLWSGFKRNTELAESFSQPMITMMRRGGVLSAPLDSQNLIPNQNDTGQTLEAKWQTWAQRESFKSPSETPLMNFTELSFSVPASRELFLAESATDWKSKYMKKLHSPVVPPPRLIDFMHNFCGLENMDESWDIDLCCEAALNGFWGQIWAVGESTRFHGIDENRDSVHRLWITTQQRELYREVESFRERALLRTNSPIGFEFTAELFLLALCVSPDELQRFAGKSGQEAASLSLKSLERWYTTERARRAIWHAGQIFNCASFMAPAQLRDFHAVALYFASLTMWAYGHLSNSLTRESNNEINKTRDYSQPEINLMGPDSRETRTFISTGQGAAILIRVPRNALDINNTTGTSENDDFTLNNEKIQLSNPNLVLKTARDLFRSNFPILEEPLPPLVENCSNLMRDLSDVPESRFSRCVSPVDK